MFVQFSRFFFPFLKTQDIKKQTFCLSLSEHRPFFLTCSFFKAMIICNPNLILVFSSWHSPQLALEFTLCLHHCMQSLKWQMKDFWMKTASQAFLSFDSCLDFGLGL